ncbi:CDP-glycerol glycerophosphotransferase family protein [Desulfonatronovibrio magnus]|uniref:CDP-glycerol glycerophosphotransferase family protein n=1 Tax=Desulfonatronovibrio magnus TaxID=698827 RepID=UPI0005EB8CCD|nr:CDP-glycerol glycerophosphotransferase family protein [Desulfonatronovibrio magnus]
MSLSSCLHHECDVLFYAERSLHLPYLEPIHDYLKKNYPHLDLLFAAPTYIATSMDEAGVGLSEYEIQRISKKGNFCPDSSKIQARIAVVADVCHLRIPHISRVINVGHGLICKGLYYCRSNIIRRENLSEMMCVPGPWHKKRLKDNVFIPIEVTGFIKSDLLFGPDSSNREKFCTKYNINPDKKILLYAPTYNKELSSIPSIKDNIVKLVNKDTNLIIKLHHMTPPEWKEMYKKIAGNNDNILYLKDNEYSSMMHAADVMVSDVSSIFVEFMLLDKPVVLFNNPELINFPDYNPNNIEYKIRDAVQEADTFPQLQQEIEKALENSQMLSAQRRHYIEELDYGQDGQSAGRAGEAIYSRLDQKNYISRQKNSYSIFLLLDEEDDNKVVQETLRQIADKSSQHSIEIFPVCNSESVKFSWQEQKIPIMAVENETLKLNRALSLARGNMGVILKPGWYLSDNWLKWLNNHFLWNQGTGMVKAAQDINLVRSAFDNVLSDARPPVLCKSMSAALLNLCIGRASVNDRLTSSCAMIPLPVLKACTEAVPEIFNGDILQNLDMLVTNMGLMSLTALDTLIYPMDQQFFIWDKQALMDAVAMLKKEGLMDEAVKLMQKNHQLFS